MRYREFGRTGMEVSAIGTGTWAISGVRWGPTDDGESVRGIQRAVDLGVTLFDTVDVFGDGRSEELLGDALRGRRHGVRIITKGGINFYRRPHEQDFTPSYLDRALGESLRRLRTDYIDVYMLHSPTADALAESDLYDFLERLQGQGRLLAYGASVATVEDATRAIATGRFSCLEVPYNILDQDMATEVLPQAQQAGMAVVARAPLALGMLTGKLTRDTQFHRQDVRSGWDRDEYLRRLEKVERLRWLVHDDVRSLTEAALAFTLSHPAITAAVPGFRTTDQIEEHVRAADLFPLPQEDLDELADMYEDDFGFGLPHHVEDPWKDL